MSNSYMSIKSVCTKLLGFIERVNLSKYSKHFMVAYVVLFTLLVIYIQFVLKSGDPIQEKKPTQKPVEQKVIDVTLAVCLGEGQACTNADAPVQKFDEKLKNTETVGDLLNKMRNSKVLMYEKLLLTTGTELKMFKLTSINIQNESARLSQNNMGGNEYQWRILDTNGKDITNVFEETYLEDDATYLVYPTRVTQI